MGVVTLLVHSLDHQRDVRVQPRGQRGAMAGIAVEDRPGLHRHIGQVAGQVGDVDARVGGAAGTIAKSMSAYDMAVSDAIYGSCERYVCRPRLQSMLDYEHDLGDPPGHEGVDPGGAGVWDLSTNEFGDAQLYHEPNHRRDGGGYRLLADQIAGLDAAVRRGNWHLEQKLTLDEAADIIASYTGRPRRDDLSGLAKNLRQREGRYYWHWDPNFLTLRRDAQEGVTRRMPERIVDRLEPVEIDEQ